MTNPNPTTQEPRTEAAEAFVKVMSYGVTEVDGKNMGRLFRFESGAVFFMSDADRSAIYRILDASPSAPVPARGGVKAVEAEREACARIANSMSVSDGPLEFDRGFAVAGGLIALAIRERASLSPAPTSGAEAGCEPVAWVNDSYRDDMILRTGKCYWHSPMMCGQPFKGAHPVYLAPPATPASEPAGGDVDAWRDVLAERRRQIEAEGWTPAHDDAHDKREMARAAACYALTWTLSPTDSKYVPHKFWPWSLDWWKPSDPRRNLVKAGALILAEIERLDRAALSQSSGGRG